MPEHHGPLLTQDPHPVVDCAACGFAHLLPIPAQAVLDAHYEQEYYASDGPPPLDKDRAERSFWALEHEDKLDAWTASLGQGPSTLLDVGCGGGLLLEHARERGWAVRGIEPASAAAAECRRLGLDVVEAPYAEAGVAPASADVVHARLVLEHLADPAAFARWAAGVVRPGGVVCVQVPNDFSVLQRHAREAHGLPAWWVAPPDHVNYFSFDSLEGLLRSAGLEPVDRDATFPMEWFLLMGVDYVRDGAAGAESHARRMRLEAGLEAAGERRALHAHLAARGLGREAIVHARRPGA